MTVYKWEARGYHWPFDRLCFKCMRSKLGRKRQDLCYQMACWLKSNHDCTGDLTCHRCILADRVIAKVLKARQGYREECIRVRGVIV